MEPLAMSLRNLLQALGWVRAYLIKGANAVRGSGRASALQG